MLCSRSTLLLRRWKREGVTIKNQRTVYFPKVDAGRHCRSNPRTPNVRHVRSGVKIMTICICIFTYIFVTLFVPSVPRDECKDSVAHFRRLGFNFSPFSRQGSFVKRPNHTSLHMYSYLCICTVYIWGRKEYTGETQDTVDTVDGRILESELTLLFFSFPLLFL